MQTSRLQTLRYQHDQNTSSFDKSLELSFVIQGVVLVIFGALATIHEVQGLLLMQCDDQNRCRILRSGMRPTRWEAREKVEDSWWEFFFCIAKLGCCTTLSIAAICSVWLACLRKKVNSSEMEMENQYKGLCLALTSPESEIVKHLPMDLRRTIAQLLD
jgi:hypothetical protein